MKQPTISRLAEDVYLAVFTSGAQGLPFDGVGHNKPALRYLHKKALNAARQARKGVSLIRGTKTPAKATPVSAYGLLEGAKATVDPFEDIFGRSRKDVGEYEVYLQEERGSVEEEPDFCAPTLRQAILYARRQCAQNPMLDGCSFVVEAVEMPLVTVSVDGVLPIGEGNARRYAEESVAALLTWEEIVEPLLTPIGKDD